MAHDRSHARVAASCCTVRAHAINPPFVLESRGSRSSGTNPRAGRACTSASARKAPQARARDGIDLAPVRQRRAVHGASFGRKRSTSRSSPDRSGPAGVWPQRLDRRAATPHRGGSSLLAIAGEARTPSSPASSSSSRLFTRAAAIAGAPSSWASGMVVVELGGWPPGRRRSPARPSSAASSWSSSERRSSNRWLKGVSPEGIEPSTLGLKGRCSTTELWALGVRRNLKDLGQECKSADAPCRAGWHTCMRWR